jgi:hypothetical protein
MGRKSGENGGKNANHKEKIWGKTCEEQMELGSIPRKIQAIGIDFVGSLGSVGTRAEGSREKERETQSWQEEKGRKYRSSRSSYSCSCHVCLLLVVSLTDKPVDR